MPRQSTFPMPLRVLLVLLVAVLLAHALLLSRDPTVLRAASEPTTVWATRQMEAAPVPIAQPVAAAPQPDSPMLAAPSKKPPPSANLKPKTPAAQQNIAAAAPEVIAKYEPTPVEPVLAPTVNTPTETAALREDTPPMPPPTPEAAQSVAQPPTAASASPATPTRSLTDAELAQREANEAQRRALKLQFPPSGELSYNATQISGGQPQNGSGTLKWTTDGSAYQIRLESSVLGFTVLTQTSVGTLGAEGLQPERFSDKRLNRSERAAHFQRDAGKITFSGKQTSTPLQSGAQDRLSMLMQLAAMAAGSATQLVQAGQIAFQVTNTEEADTWLFLVQAPEQIQVPAGQTLALHLVRTPRKEFDARLELWLAPNLGYLPVRMKQTEANGNTLELQLRSPVLR